MPFDSQTISILNKLLWIIITTAGLVLITYPPTKLTVNIRHKRTLRLIGGAWILYNFLLAISLKTTHLISRGDLAWTLRTLELAIVTAIIIWGAISIKEKITLR